MKKLLALLLVLGMFNGINVHASEVVSEEKSEVVSEEDYVEQKARDLGIKQLKELVGKEPGYEGETRYDDSNAMTYLNRLNRIEYTTYSNGNWYTPYFYKNVTGSGVVLDDKVTYSSKEVKEVGGVQYSVFYYTGDELDAVISLHLEGTQLIYEITYTNKSDKSVEIETMVDFDTCLSESGRSFFDACMEDYIPLYSQGGNKGIYLNSERYDVNLAINYLGKNKPDYSRAYRFASDPNLVSNQISAGKDEVLLEKEDTVINFGWNESLKANSTITYRFSIGMMIGEFVPSDEYQIEADTKQSTKEETELSKQEILELFNVEATKGNIVNLSSSVKVDQSAVDYSTPGEYDVVFSIINDEGNKVQTIAKLIVTDVLPTISLQSEGVEVEDVNADLVALFGAYASEITSGDLTTAITYDNSQLDTSTSGEYTVTFSVYDEEGNKASVQGIAKIIADTKVADEKSEVSKEFEDEKSEVSKEFEDEKSEYKQMEVKSSDVKLAKTGQENNVMVLISLGLLTIFGLIKLKRSI